MVNLEIFDGTPTEWDDALLKLEGATFYQKYSWGVHKGKTGWKVVRFVYKKERASYCMAQILIKHLPIKGAFFWIPGGIVGDVSYFDVDLIKRQLGLTYVFIRSSFNSFSEKTKAILQNDGWKKARYRLNSGLSMVIDPSKDWDILRTKMSKNWRHNLNRSKKKELFVSRWINPPIEMITKHYRELEKMKGIAHQYSKDDINSILKNIDPESLLIYKAEDKDGNLLGFRGFGVLGDKAWDLMAVTTNDGRKCYASYALFERVLEECKALKIKTFDFSGISPQDNKGVYSFKKGSGADEVSYIGEWDYASMPLIRYCFNKYLEFRKV